MFYITVPQSPVYRQMTLDELLFSDDIKPIIINSNTSNTKTYEVEEISDRFSDNIEPWKLLSILKNFNEKYEALRNHTPRSDLYYSFHIPKRSGGLRKIDAPNDDLKTALRELKEIFETDFKALYHTSAFAYIKKRSTIHAVKRHQQNESKWFGKFDLSNFFGSTTIDFTLKMLSHIFPFSEVMRYDEGKIAMKDALDIAFLDGGLPQGTPISPLLTNIIMIPIDFKLYNGLRDFERQSFVYTRYADDFLVSSRYDFDVKKIEKFIVDTLASFGAPFTINQKKTRYGSSSGRNWNLGVMLTKDNTITVGHKKKKQFQTMLAAYIMDNKNGKHWDKSDVQVLEGYRSYFKMVEGEAIDRMVSHVAGKFDVDVVAMIKQDLSN